MAGMIIVAQAPDGTLHPLHITADGKLVVDIGQSDITLNVSQTGLATSANQTTELASLASIDGKLHAGTTGVVSTVANYLDTLPTVQYVAAGVTLSDGQFTNLLGTISGFAKVSLGDEIAGENRTDGVMFMSPRAIASTTGAWTNYASSAKVGTAGISVKTTSGRVRSIRAVSANTTTLLYLLVCDKASAPVANDLPIDATPIPANTAASIYSYAEIDWSSDGKTVTNGFAFAISTTPDKVTLPATSDVMVFARYA